MTVRDEVIAQFKQVAHEQGKRLAPLNDDLLLAESGLDSLCLAIIVARLEDVFGIDPFHASLAAEVSFPLTFGDFVARYQHAAK
jgi:acyl carrier protein